MGGSVSQLPSPGRQPPAPGAARKAPSGKHRAPSSHHGSGQRVGAPRKAEGQPTRGVIAGEGGGNRAGTPGAATRPPSPKFRPQRLTGVELGDHRLVLRADPHAAAGCGAERALPRAPRPPPAARQPRRAHRALHRWRSPSCPPPRSCCCCSRWGQQPNFCYSRYCYDSRRRRYCYSCPAASPTPPGPSRSWLAFGVGGRRTTRGEEREGGGKGV